MPRKLIEDQVDTSLGMIGDDTQGSGISWVKVGVMKTSNGAPKRDSVDKFLKLKGFDPKSYDVRLSPKGQESVKLAVYEVSILPKETAKGISGAKLNSRMDAPISDSFGAPPPREMDMGRREFSDHTEIVRNPDKYYNENDNYTVIDSRDEDRALGVGAGKGMFGTPATSLVSDAEGVITMDGYSGPHGPKDERFPYGSGVGESVFDLLKRKKKEKKVGEKGWENTKVILGLDKATASENFVKEKAKLQGAFPNKEFKMDEQGAPIAAFTVQKRRMGVVWDSLRSFPATNLVAANEYILQMKQRDPKGVYRAKQDTKQAYYLFARAK